MTIKKSKKNESIFKDLIHQNHIGGRIAAKELVELVDGLVELAVDGLVELVVDGLVELVVDGLVELVLEGMVELVLEGMVELVHTD